MIESKILQSNELNEIADRIPEKNLKVIFKRADYYVRQNVAQTDIGKIKRLGWSPKIDIVQGFRRTVSSIE
jgi:nucleoside-diphosphate-sugar epimerase